MSSLIIFGLSVLKGFLIGLGVGLGIIAIYQVINKIFTQIWMRLGKLEK